MAKKRLFVDMDGTLARFHDQIGYLERMYEKDFFLSLEPFHNMVAGIRQFMTNYPDVEVFILSAKIAGDPPYCEEEKNAWLDLYLPEIDQDHRIFSEAGRPKAEYIPGGITRDDYLLDDYNRYLNLFLYDGGSAIKCHNNINQKGLGAFGGEAGRMWLGSMIHTEDKPELIAAELAHHMGLEYDLNKVVQAFRDITLVQDAPFRHRHGVKNLVQNTDGTFTAVGMELDGPFLPTFHNPLNALRVLSGNGDFLEYHLEDYEGNPVTATVQQLRAVCLNQYHDADYMSFYRADRCQLASDTILAISNAERPVAGRIDYLTASGTVVESRLFYSETSMQQELEQCTQSGRTILANWYIEPKFPPLEVRLHPDEAEYKDIQEDSFTHHSPERISNRFHHIKESIFSLVMNDRYTQAQKEWLWDHSNKITTQVLQKIDQHLTETGLDYDSFCSSEAERDLLDSFISSENTYLSEVLTLETYPDEQGNGTFSIARGDLIQLIQDCDLGSWTLPDFLSSYTWDHAAVIRTGLEELQYKRFGNNLDRMIAVARQKQDIQVKDPVSQRPDQQLEYST